MDGVWNDMLLSHQRGGPALLKSSPRLAYSAVLLVKMPIPTWKAKNHQHITLDAASYGALLRHFKSFRCSTAIRDAAICRTSMPTLTKKVGSARSRSRNPLRVDTDLGHKYPAAVVLYEHASCKGLGAVGFYM